MNPFKTGPALMKVFGTAKKFNKNIPKLQALREAGDIEAEKELIWKASGEWAVETSEKLGVKYEISGEENIPKSGPVMVYANHQGLADILAIYYLFRNHFQIGFISKDEWRKLKPLADAIEYTRSVFLVREDPREAIRVIGEASELMANGFSLAIFPEGTRSHSHEMADFKPGSFKFAERAKVPILPITLDGSYKMFEETGNFKPGQTIRITVHPLVHLDGLTKSELRDTYTSIEATIRNGLKQ